MKTLYIPAGIIALVMIVALWCFVFGDCSLLTPDQKGRRAFQAGDYEEAAEDFIDPMWRGASLYRAGNFKESAGMYSGFDTAESAYNHGTCLVMLGKYEDAVKRYIRALELRPGWEAAETNLRIARQRAEKLKKEGGEMTGGKLEADEIVFNENMPEKTPDTEEVSGEQEMSDKERRAMWLRNVQTRPADFLRAKFSYQVAMQDISDVGKPAEADTSTDGKK